MRESKKSEGGLLKPPPPPGSYRVNDSLEKLLHVIHKERKYAYILGDFNVNTISEFTGTASQCQQFTNIFLAHYYWKLIHLPT